MRFLTTEGWGGVRIGMREVIAVLMFLSGGCTACGDPARESREYEPDPCAGFSKEAAFAPTAIAGADAPQLLVEPVPLLLSSERPEAELRVVNVGRGCLRIGDTAIVQSTQVDLALHPGDYWFETAELQPDDETSLSVRWRVDAGPVNGFIVIQSNEPTSDGGISEIPVEAR